MGRKTTLKHILSVNQFDRNFISKLFNSVDGKNSDVLKGKVLTCLFYEPSTRTSSSFIAAMERLGGSVIPITQGVQYSSVSKGETLEDTILTLAQYSDVIVLRHPEVGAAQRAAKVSPVPIINAGDGVGEHPTQALLDLYTIQSELGRINGLKVAVVGDLKNGRTVHSLSKLLNLYDVELYGVAPNNLGMSDYILDELNYLPYRKTKKLEDVIDFVDVLYMTRVQKERFTDLTEYERLKNYYILTPELMKQAKQKMIVMHPLPRVGEIDTRVDNDPRAVYFKQVKNGLHVRMALLKELL